MRNIVIITMALGLVLAACAGSTGDSVEGVVILTDFDSVSDGGDDMGTWNDCEGQGGYSDISDGINVSIEDQDGRRIGASSLQNIAESDLDRFVETQDDFGESTEEVLGLLKQLEGVVCVFTFQADSVEDAEIYVLKVGSRRGELSYTKEQMEEQDWFINVSLGDS